MRNWKLFLTGVSALTAIQFTTAIAQANPIDYGTVKVTVYQCPYTADIGKYAEQTTLTLVLNSTDNVNYTGELTGLTSFINSVKQLHADWKWSTLIMPVNDTVKTPLSTSNTGTSGDWVKNTVGESPTSGLVSSDVFNIATAGISNVTCVQNVPPGQLGAVGIDIMK